MNIKTLLFAILIFLNSLLLHAHSTSDTIITVHDQDVVFPEYNSDAEILVVLNTVLDPLKNKSSFQIDIYVQTSPFDKDPDMK